MGKKTKKEKIIADYRRRIAKLKNYNPNLIYLNQETHSPQSFPSTNECSEIQPLSSSIILIKKDLTKTLVLSILTVSFEYFLFLVFQGKIKLPVIKLVLPISLIFY